MENTIEIYQKDLDELDSIIINTISKNLKRQFEEHRKTILSVIQSEKKKLEIKANQEKSQPVQTEERYETITKYAFDGSGDSLVKVYITDGFAGLNGHPSENIIANFKPNAFEVYVKNWNSRNFRFVINNLNHEIEESGSYAKSTKSGLVIGLKKKNKSDFWDNLEKKKGLIDDKKLKSKENPENSLMDMMKDLYQNVIYY
jgi:calcyclin binding protein